MRDHKKLFWDERKAEQTKWSPLNLSSVYSSIKVTFIPNFKSVNLTYLRRSDEWTDRSKQKKIRVISSIWKLPFQQISNFQVISFWRYRVKEKSTDKKMYRKTVWRISINSFQCSVRPTADFHTEFEVCCSFYWQEFCG